MTRRIPPFPAIRAFEAAARHLSFKQAAEELHVTPSAISHQVKALEQYLGVALFRRKPQGVNLTDAGKTYLPLVGGALDRIASASERLKSDGLTGPLAVGMSSAFATRWMVPRLGHFRDTFPNIDLHLTTVVPPVVPWFLSPLASKTREPPGSFKCSSRTVFATGAYSPGAGASGMV